MAQPIRPGVFAPLFAKIIAETQLRAEQFVERLALEMAADARESLTQQGAHPYGTPTPAFPGGPPAVISGNLHQSVTAEPLPESSDTFTMVVGTSGGYVPPYPPHATRRTPADEYGLFLEKRGYPWFVPSFRRTMTPEKVKLAAQEIFDGGWPRLT